MERDYRFINGTLNDVLEGKDKSDLIFTLAYLPLDTDPNSDGYSYEYLDLAELTIKSQSGDFMTHGISFHSIEAAPILRSTLWRQKFYPFCYSDASMPEFRLIHYKYVSNFKGRKLVVYHDNVEVGEWIRQYHSSNYPWLYDKNGDKVFMLERTDEYNGLLYICPVTVGRHNASTFPVRFELKAEELLTVKEAVA